MHDLDDLSNRLLRILTGAMATASRGDLPANAIIVSRHMGPAELLDYDRAKVRGVVLEEGGTVVDIAVAAGKSYNFGFAIHDDYSNARFHHVSLGYTLALDNPKADINAVKQ